MTEFRGSPSALDFLVSSLPYLDIYFNILLLNINVIF